MDSLLSEGYIVLDLPVGLDRCKPLKSYFAHCPEFKKGCDDELVLGGFGAHGHPSSFHHPDIRFLRKYIFEKLFPKFKETFSKNFSKVEILFDRVCRRKVGRSLSSETWHRDICPNISDGDIILGGWANLDERGTKPQIFSCVPKTHLDKSDMKGFSKFSKEKQNFFKTKSKKVLVYPGQILLFYQNLVHEVKSGKITFDSDRLFLGWRLTNHDCVLFENKFKCMEEQSIPFLPSGQLPPMYAKLHMVNHKHLVENFSQKIETFFLNHETGLVKRFLPSLKEAGVMFTPYSQDDIEVMSLHIF